MRARISKVGLIIFVILMVLSFFLLSVPGDDWPWYAIAGAFAIVPLLVGPNRYRSAGAILVLSVLLIMGDIQLGKNFRAKRQQIEDNYLRTNSVSQTVPK